MDVRRSINTGIWSDPFVENLNPIHKLVWLYLLTNQHTNMIGIYQVSTRRICFETGLDNETVSKAFEAFQSLSKAFIIVLKDSSEWVFLPNWVKNQSMNTNMLKAASKQFDSLPNELIDNLLTNHYETLRKALKGLGNPSENMKLKLKGEIEIESEAEIFQKTDMQKTASQIAEEEKQLFKEYYDYMSQQTRLDNIGMRYSIPPNHSMLIVKDFFETRSASILECKTKRHVEQYFHNWAAKPEQVQTSITNQLRILRNGKAKEHIA